MRIKEVAFVFNESPVTDIYIKVRKGYEYLAKELVDYARKNEDLHLFMTMNLKNLILKMN